MARDIQILLFKDFKLNQHYLHTNTDDKRHVKYDYDLNKEVFGNKKLKKFLFNKFFLPLT